MSTPFILTVKYSGTTEQPDVEVDGENFVVCDETLCKIRKAGNEAVTDFFIKNRKVPRPRCANLSSLYWDQMDCSDSGKTI